MRPLMTDRGSDGHPIASAEHTERRKARREMQLDRRRSAIDVIERVALGLRRSQIVAANDPGPRRPNKT
jgi:hypothetical protein